MNVMLSNELNKILLIRRKELLKQLESLDALIDATDDQDFYKLLTNSYLNQICGSKALDVKAEDSDSCKFINEGSTSKITMKHCNVAKEEISNPNYFNTWFVSGTKRKLTKTTDKTWKAYLLDVIENLGGESKTSTIAKFIINNNDNLTFVQARQIAADILPELVKDGYLEVEKGDSKKEGHIYRSRAVNIKDWIKKYKNESTHKDAL